MRQTIAAFVAGLVFATGLALSGMTDPSKVIAFLDVSGAWAPDLILVMLSAIGVYAVSYGLIVRRSAPLLTSTFALPKLRRPDGRMIAGAAIFGVGWGLAGLCPGPALVSVATGQVGIAVFIATMLVGLRIVPSPKSLPAPDDAPAPSGLESMPQEPITNP